MQDHSESYKVYIEAVNAATKRGVPQDIAEWEPRAHMINENVVVVENDVVIAILTQDRMRIWSNDPYPKPGIERWLEAQMEICRLTNVPLAFTYINRLVVRGSAKIFSGGVIIFDPHGQYSNAVADYTLPDHPVLKIKGQAVKVLGPILMVDTIEKKLRQLISNGVIHNLPIDDIGVPGY